MFTSALALPNFCCGGNLVVSILFCLREVINYCRPVSEIYHPMSGSVALWSQNQRDNLIFSTSMMNNVTHTHHPHAAHRYQSGGILGMAKLNLEATGGKMAFLMEEGWHQMWVWERADQRYFSGGTVGAINLGQPFLGRQCVGLDR